MDDSKGKTIQQINWLAIFGFVQTEVKDWKFHAFPKIISESLKKKETVLVHVMKHMNTNAAGLLIKQSCSLILRTCRVIVTSLRNLH
jgi:hypothetical protein